ncbi:MAG: PhoH family protein [Rhodospirillaceae bacterium]|nr:PhoH family protein [Rhodospirillaceae bacterium]MBT6139358.1 PhoH family protein [Rhodospirillaceae bacterium]
MSTETIGTSAIQLEFDDHGLLPFLFGDHDRNLARIEQKLGVSLACFGNTVRISGEEGACATARTTLESLYGRLAGERDSGGGVVPLELGIVDAAIKYAAVEDSGGGDDARFDDRSATLGTWRRGVEPRSPNQHAYIEALRRDELVFGLGPAGTGKTYLAVAMAVAMLKERKVDRLILSRPAVEAGERLGFLPGDLREKIDPYLRPLYDALYDMMSGEQVERQLAAGEIEVAPLAFMRGRTLSNAFVILDEAQNTTPTQMKMFLTRLGENSRMVVTGDLSQIDLPFGAKSGLRDATDTLKGVKGISYVEFTAADVVRHPLVTRIVHAYNRKEGPLISEDNKQ